MSRLSALVLASLVSLAVWGGVWGMIPQVKWGALHWTWLLYGVAASLMIWGTRAARLWALDACSFRVALRVVAVHGGLLRVTPMRMGELSLPYLLQRWAQVPVLEGSALLLWVRLSELIALCVAVTVALLSDHRVLNQLTVITARPALTVAASALCVFVLYLALRGAKRWVSVLCEALHSAGHRSGWGALSRLAERVQLGHQRLPELSRGRLALLLGASGLIFTTQLALFWSVLAACGVTVSCEGLTLGSAVTHMGGVLPLPTLGNVGGHELSWTVGFMAVGVPKQLALLSAVLSQFVTLALALLWWGLSCFLPLPSKESTGRSVEE